MPLDLKAFQEKVYKKSLKWNLTISKIHSGIIISETPVVERHLRHLLAHLPINFFYNSVFSNVFTIFSNIYINISLWTKSGGFLGKYYKIKGLNTVSNVKVRPNYTELITIEINSLIFCSNISMIDWWDYKYYYFLYLKKI